jgi:hypothetical protein
VKGGFAAFKVQDVAELQDLVASHVEFLEPGLTVLDARVLLGEATIDLVGVDKESALTLVALGFEADDATLLRALDAYAFCLESPDAVRRLYPAARFSAGEPPRLIVVAERIPEAFLRRMRHLRVQRVDCVEFSVGLRFDRIGGSRGTEPPSRIRTATDAARADLAAERPADAADRARAGQVPAADQGRAAGVAEPPSRPGASTSSASSRRA